MGKLADERRAHAYTEERRQYWQFEACKEHERAETAASAERARIVAVIRDIAKRYAPKAANTGSVQVESNRNALRDLADAIESGHAFPGGNP